MTTKPVDQRILSLDVTRGVAVMGIFSVNVVGMAMIKTAYFYPPAFGFEHLSDKLMWLANFLFIDGKLRSLFSIMFGASTLLIADRAIAAGRSPWKTHYARMVTLLILGALHFFVLWWGDILTHYAAVGMVAFLFYKLRPRILLGLAIFGFLFYATPSAYFSFRSISDYEAAAAPDASPKLRKEMEQAKARTFPNAERLAEDRAIHASIPAHLRAQLKDGPLAPLDLGPLWIETLSLMLLGMWGYKSGFLTGQWERQRYRRVATAGLGIGLAVYAACAYFTYANGFRPPYHYAAYGGFSPLFRPVMAIGYAALIMLLVAPGGWLTTRLAAVGRTAFTNYLGCTIIGTFVFFGFAGDLYAQLSRSQAWLLVPPVWLLMLAWSKPWLDRFQYGPFEWLWRSLARMKLQPMRKDRAALGAPTGD